ncbi:MAG: hypothetical protein LBH40_00130 [Alphaproteobacteria bacterium]|nr:hypothetical protein [Alphaproteobacteria bacterium]
MNNLFDKGNFVKINNHFMSEGIEVLQQVSKVQEKYNKHDTDTFINELRDSICGYYLGFDLVNTEKHGFDCKNSTTNKYLEVKSASFSANSWSATFNDTTLEKAESFTNNSLYLALAIWKNASDLLFICFGQHPEIGKYLKGKIEDFNNQKSKRSTQTISLTKLIFDYNFKILTTKSKEDLLQILITKNSTFKKINPEIILSLNEFKEI